MDFVIPQIQNFVKTTSQQEWAHYNITKLVITPDGDLTLLINGIDNIKVKQGQTLEITYDDLDVKSIVAKTNNIHSMDMYISNL